MISQHSVKSKNSKDVFRIQEVFLNHCRRKRVPVTIQGKGESANGYIIGFDPDAIVLEENSTQMLFYKDQIYSITPEKSVHCIFASQEACRRDEREYPVYHGSYLN